MATIFRIYALYRPLKTFFAIGSVLMFAGVAIGARFLWIYVRDGGAGHVQSLILAAVFLITGFHTWLIALLADLIAVNRRLSEDVLVRVKRLESPGAERKARPQPQPQVVRDRAPRPAREAKPAAEGPQTQWVWLLDEDKLEERGTPPQQPAAIEDDEPEEIAGQPAGAPPRKRRRRRGGGGARPRPELPGNRGKHLGEE